MRLSVVLLALCASLLVAGVSAVSNTQHETDVRTPPAAQRTLAIVQSRSLLQSHSGFFQILRARGHNLTFAVAGEDAVKLDKFGTSLYENLVLLAPSAEELGEGASLDNVQRFVDSGRSVLLVGDVAVGEPVRELAAEIMNIDIHEDQTRVQDHSNFAETEDAALGGHHDLVRATVAKRAASFIGSEAASGSKPLLFRGIGHSATASALLTPLLVGSGSAYSAALGQPLTEYPAAAGADVGLVTALQTRSNARVLFAGSLDLFSNALLFGSVRSESGKSEPSGNEALVRDLSAWLFHERGLLRARNLTHYKVGAEHDVNPGSYRVQDHIRFSVVLEEYSGDAHTWVPYVSSEPVQLEFTMLDPYVRLNLEQASGAAGVYQAAFQVPDVYGVYKFVLVHPRAGYSALDVAKQVSIHPFRHNEFERFIGQAYPYYTAAFTMMAAFLVFGILFLYQSKE